MAGFSVVENDISPVPQGTDIIEKSIDIVDAFLVTRRRIELLLPP